MLKGKELSIREEQEIQLQIMHYFDNICKKENLRYYLAYGTLLGAIRERGFIAWDDDVDIWMPREDFEKFSEVFPIYATDRFFLQNSRTDKNNVSPEMTRICVNGTYKWPNGCEKENFHTGIYFDIFPLDYGFGTAQDEKDLQKAKTYHTEIFKSLRRKQAKTLKGFIHCVCTWLIPRRLYAYKLIRLIESHRKCKSNVLLSFPSAYAGLCRSHFDSGFFENVEYVPFEDMLLPVPAKYDELLCYMYGDDYMLPAVTKPARVIAYLTK